MLIEADLPNDVEALRALVLEQTRELDTLKVFQAEVERLKAIIEGLQRHDAKAYADLGFIRNLLSKSGTISKDVDLEF